MQSVFYSVSNLVNFREVLGLATDLEITKWLINGRVRNDDKISSGPLNKIYSRVVESTPLLQVHEVLENRHFVAVVDSEDSKGKPLVYTSIYENKTVFC